MSLRFEGDVVFLEDECHVEQAEQLLQFLQASPGRTVDLSGCRHLHSALAQLLLSLNVRVSGEPEDLFLRQFVAPNFQPSEDRIDE